MIRDCHVGVKGIVKVADKCLVLKKGTGENAYWDIPDGRIDDDETLEETLSRELSEELPGIINYKVGSVLGAYRLSKDIDDNKALVLIFFSVDAEDFEVKLSSEHSSFRWVNKENVSELLETNIPIEQGYYDAVAKALN
jgi:8-oxo-dGTP diphosphatase